MNDEKKSRESLIREIEQLRIELCDCHAAEESARNREEFLREILDSCPVMIQATDREGRFLFSNRAVEKCSGFTAEEMQQLSPTDYIPPEELGNLAELGETIYQSPEGTTMGVRFRLKAKDGRFHTVDWTLVHKPKAPIGGMVCFGKDITDHVEVHDIPFRADESLRAVFNGIHDAIVVHDSQGRVLQVNRKTIEMLEIPSIEPDLMFLSADSYYSFQDNRESLSEIWEQVLEGRPRLCDGKGHKASDGSTFDAEVALSPIRFADREAILVVLRDISDRKRAERELRIALETTSRLRKEAEAASAAKSEFLTSMGHELRTPLNAVIGFSELLEDQWVGKLNEKQLEYVKHIFSSGHHLLQLINDVLDLAKVEAGRMELRVSRVNIGDLLKHSLNVIRQKTIKHRIALKCQVHDSIAGTEIRADDVKLKQIVANLLSNAAKFTPEGGSISLEARKNGTDLMVSVSDTGIGLNPEHHQRIFEAFEQVDSAYSRRQEGTGLGLALTRRMVELHGGRIWVESEGENQGSTFTFVIPFVEADTPEIQPSVGPVPDAVDISAICPTLIVDDAERPGVLVVEDNEANMKLTRNILETGGYVVEEARTAEDGIRMAMQSPPDLILMDISLPGMDGLAATGVLKQEAKTTRVPVIALTAHAMSEDEQRAKDAGCDAYLTKPVDTKTFYQTLAQFIPDTTGKAVA